MNIVASKKGIDLLVYSEVSSEAYYEKFLQHPCLPGGQSGVTIGIGYDISECSKNTFINDWHDFLSIEDLNSLITCVGLKGNAAKNAISNQKVKKIKVSLDSAKKVFYKNSLIKYTKETHNLYPGLEKLHPDAIGALISMIYNRGASIHGNGREEMASIVHLVAVEDYNGIAAMISHSKRIWQGKKGLEGILKRRDAEASLVINSNHNYEHDDLIIINI